MAPKRMVETIAEYTGLFKILHQIFQLENYADDISQFILQTEKV